MSSCSSRMDIIDLKLIRELFQGPPMSPLRRGRRESFRKMGRKLGVADEALRERLKRMIASGLIAGFPLQLNVDLLKCNIGILSIDIEPGAQKKEVVEKISLVDGVFIIQTHVGTLAGVIFYYTDQKSLQNKIALITKIANTRNALFTRFLFPKSTISLSKTDLKIVSILGQNLDRPYNEIAKALQISVRTVRRRMTRMIDGAALFTLPSINASKIRGAVMADLLVEYEDTKSRQGVDSVLVKLLDPYYFFAGLWESYSVYSLIIHGIPATKEILESVRKIKGVKSVRIELVEERYEFYERMNDLTPVGQLATPIAR
ncbi:MAG: Lrp/AsnC family transcriptional regulator [Nitrososphaerota archaeon]|nr:Lrp/AsnC family transcriptional regulator [Nitrososphaerota archaeon]